jgi:WD40 repeat protein
MKKIVCLFIGVSLLFAGSVQQAIPQVTGVSCIELEGHAAHTWSGVTFSPDGKKFVTISHEEGTVRLWTVE